MASVVRPLEIFTKAAEHRIANDNGAVAMEHRVRTAELQCPSIITGNIHSLGELTKKYYKEKQCQLTEETDECRTDLIACLELLRKAKATQPTLVLGGLSGRLDHTLATLHSLVQAQSLPSSSSSSPIYVLDGDNLVCVLPKGTHRLALERAHLTDVCGITPICQNETRVSTRGFRWNLEDKPLSFGSLISTSNELASDEVSLTTTAPIIVTFELLSSITGLEEPPN